MVTVTNLFTNQEVSEHNSQKDCWIVIHGKVYNVATYLDEHPGGDDVILGVAGKDATDDFEDAGHSESARSLLESFCIGKLDAPEKHPAQNFVELTKQYWAVPVTLVGISVLVSFLYLRKK